MNDERVTNQNKEFNTLLASWATFYKKDAKALVNHLRSEGYSETQIGKILLKKPVNLKKIYPREEVKNA